MPRSRQSVILGVICFLAGSPLQAEEIQWRVDYAAARREARETNRPLLMDFGTANCTWCRKLEATTFRDPAVIKLVNEQFIAVKVDADRSKELTAALNIQSFPTLVFAASDGKILGTQKGFVEAAALQSAITARPSRCRGSCPNGEPCSRGCPASSGGGNAHNPDRECSANHGPASGTRRCGGGPHTTGTGPIGVGPGGF